VSSVYVDEVQARVVSAPPSAEASKTKTDEPRPGAAEAAWEAAYRLVRRDSCRTRALDFDD
jgi:hypothetical protein